MFFGVEDDDEVKVEDKGRRRRAWLKSRERGCAEDEGTKQEAVMGGD